VTVQCLLADRFTNHMAELLADCCVPAGRENPYADVYSPSRPPPIGTALEVGHTGRVCSCLHYYLRLRAVCHKVSLLASQQPRAGFAPFSGMARFFHPWVAAHCLCACLCPAGLQIAEEGAIVAASFAERALPKVGVQRTAFMQGSTAAPFLLPAAEASS
jgi:hypothetical protein